MALKESRYEGKHRYPPPPVMVGTGRRHDSNLGPVAGILVSTAVCVGVVLLFTGALRMILAAGCVLLLVIVVVLAHRTPSGGYVRPATLLLLALSLALLLSLAVALRYGNLVGQSFLLYGQTKRLTLPVVLLLFGLLAVAIVSRPESPASTPLWWKALLAVLTLGTAAALVIPRQPLNLLDAAQGLALLLGLLLLSWFGLQARVWTTGEQHALLGMLFVAAAASDYFINGLTPFNVLLVPAAFAALLMGLTAPRHRLPYLGAAAVLGVLMVRQLLALDARTAGGLSIAIAGQVVGCVIVLLLSLSSRRLRPPLALAGLAGGVLAFFTSGTADLLSGTWQEFGDITLAQRGYETAQVLQLLGQSPVSLLLGLGPAATVDLTASPDAGTLASSGRVLAAVDDVHLLSTYLLLKLGLAGLAWALLFFVAFVRTSLRVLRDPEMQWERAVLMFVSAGAVSSLPAATNLFTNPLPMLLIGVLMARAQQRAPEEPLLDTGRTVPHPVGTRTERAAG